MVTVLEPSPEPKGYTVRSVSQTLGEHFQMFLNSNNLKGYQKEVERVLSYNYVGDILLIVAARGTTSIEKLRADGHAINKLTNKTIRINNALNLVARALGYRDWSLLMFCRNQDDTAENVWSGFEQTQHNIFAGDETVEQFAQKNKHINRLISVNAKLNLARSNAIRREQRNAEKALLGKQRRKKSLTKI